MLGLIISPFEMYSIFAILLINSREIELTMTLQTLRAANFQKTNLETNLELELALIILYCGYAEEKSMRPKVHKTKVNLYERYVLLMLMFVLIRIQSNFGSIGITLRKHVHAIYCEF